MTGKRILTGFLAVMFSLVITEGPGAEERCDLVVKSMALTSSANAGDKARVVLRIKNKGKGKAKMSHVTFYLSADNKVDPSDEYLGRLKIKSLKAKKASKQYKKHVTIPDWVPEGLYYIIAKADGSNRLKEKREKNNFKRKSISVTGASAITEIADMTFKDNNLEECVKGAAVAQGITQAHELTNLDCYGRGISSLAGLGRFPSLMVLNLGNNNISDISTLAGLKNLWIVHIYQNDISDISALAGLTKIQYLDLGYNSISDISILAGLTDLWGLVLEDNEINDISILGGLADLQYLDLGYNSISDISILAGLTELWMLDVGYNSISDISMLAGLTKLQYLDAAYNSISDISVLAGLTALEYLDAGHNNISTGLADLTDLTSAQDVRLYGNDNIPCADLIGFVNTLGPGIVSEPEDCVIATDIIADMTFRDLNLEVCVKETAADQGITQAHEMTTLDCHGRGISSLAGLGKFTGLEALNLGDNDITGISTLAGLTELWMLHLDQNSISDISTLSGLTKLQYLSLGDNYISDVSTLAVLKDLWGLGLAFNSISDISALSALTKLQYLYLGYNNVTAGAADLTALTSALEIRLYGNDNIPCADLTILINALGPGVVVEPASCVNN